MNADDLTGLFAWFYTRPVGLGIELVWFATMGAFEINPAA